MRELLTAKCQQNDDVQEQLRLTGERQIVENSPWDAYWGLGPNRDGRNMMGTLWMEVRAQLLSK